MTMVNGHTAGNFTTLADLQASKPRVNTLVSLNGIQYSVDTVDFGGGLAVNSLFANLVEGTTTALISSTRPVVSGEVRTTIGFTTNGDGGGGQWKFNDVTGQTPNQTPAQLGFALLNDGNGNQWEMIDPERITLKSCGAKGDGIADDYLAINAAAQSANINDVQLYFQAGVYMMSEKVTVTRPASDFKGFQIAGAGRGITTFRYIGTSTFDFFFHLKATPPFCINSNVGGFGIDMIGAPDGTGGIWIDTGIWRCKFSDLYIRRDSPVTRTGKGIKVGEPTVAGIGSFDLKFDELYLSGFDINLDAVGTDLSGNTMTNFSITNHYISNANTNVNIAFFNGLYIDGGQVESHQVVGVELGDGATAVIMGGSIESPIAASIGVRMNANTQSVMCIVDFFNNPGGNFISNGGIGHLVKSAQSGYVYPAGSEIRIDRDAADFGRIRFFQNGSKDVHLRPSTTANGISVCKPDGTEIFVFDINNGIIDITKTTGRLRLKDGASVEYFSGGVLVNDYMGQGSPNGSITANAGSTYRNRSGGKNNSLWVKETGAGTDTGWERVLTQEPTTSFVEFTPSISSASAGNNQMFRDSADNKLKFKDNSGVVNDLY